MKNRKLLGNILLLITTAIWGTAFAFQRMGMDSIEPATFSAVRMLSAAIILILYCGLGSGAIGYTLQIVAQKFTEPAVASLLMSLEAVFAVLGGTLILGEKMTGREAIGCLVMFIAVILAQIPSRKK